MNLMIKLLTDRAALSGAGYGILAALGSSINGIIDFDLPAVHNALEHGLVGLAVALLVYANSE